jgi:hypothetical protein
MREDNRKKIDHEYEDSRKHLVESQTGEKVRERR